MSKIKLKDHFTFTSTSTVVLPECEVLVNKQKRKIYGKNKIYLNDGDYIQIHLFNPSYYRIGVQLEFNGLLEKKLLIINPGQKILLDRFIDSKKKIKFGTYFIDGDNKKAKEAIKNNGNLVIHFWKEKIFYTANYGPQGYQGISGASGITGSSYTGNIGLTTNTTGGMGSAVITSTNLFVNETKEIETGRLEKGEKSKQKMREIEFDLDCIFHSKKFKLLPFSVIENKKKTSVDKPESVTIDSHNNYKRNTDYRIYCSNPLCGYRVRNNNWKFCPICSTEL